MRRQEEGNMRRHEEYDEEEYDEMKREHEMMMRELREEYMAKLQEDEEYMRKLQEDEEYRRNPEKYDDMDDDDMDDDDDDDDEWDEEYNKMLDEAGTYAWSTPPIDWVLDGNSSNSNKMDQPSTSNNYNSQAANQTQRTPLYPNVDPNLPFLRQRQLAHLQVVEEERRRQEEENNNNNQASNQVKKYPWGSTFPTEEEKEEGRRRQEEENRRFANATLWNGQLLRHEVHNNQLEWDNDEWTTDDDDDVDDARRQKVVRYNPPHSDLPVPQLSPSQQMRQPSPAQQMRQPSPAQQMRQDDSWREPLPSVNTFMARHMHNIQMEGSEQIKEEDADEWDEWARQERAHYNPNIRVGDDDVFYDDDHLQEAENYATMCRIDVNKVEEHWEEVEQIMQQELHELQHYLEYFQNKRRELEPLYDRAAENVARYHETFIIFEHFWKKNLAFVYRHEGCPTASTHDKKQCYESEKKYRRAENTLKERKRALDEWEETWNNLCWSLRMADGKIKALEKALRNREGWFYLSDEHRDLADDLFENWQEYA